MEHFPSPHVSGYPSLHTSAVPQLPTIPSTINRGSSCFERSFQEEDLLGDLLEPKSSHVSAEVAEVHVREASDATREEGEDELE